MRSWSLKNGGSSGITESIGAVGMKASSKRRVTFEMALKLQRLLVARTRAIILWGQILTTKNASHSFACRSWWKKAGRTGLVRFFWCLKLVLILVGRERFGSLMWILLDWFGNRAAGWQLACRLIQFVEICNILQILVPWWQRLWGSTGWYYVFSFDQKSRDMNQFFGDWEFQIGNGLGPPPPSINVLDPSDGSSLSSEKPLYLNSSSVVLPSCHVSFSPLHQMEKGKVERIVVESRLFGSLLDAICQSL